MKKLLATVMALVMALTLVPAAWADGENDNSGTTKAELTWDAATSTYTVTGDVTPTSNQIVIPANATVTLQLDGTLNASIVNKGNLTIQGDGTVNVTTGNRAAIENFPDATAAVNGGTYMSQHWYVIKNMGTMTIDGNVTVKVAENNNNPSSLIDNGWVGETDTVADGSVPAQTDKAKLYIKSGDFSGKSGSKSCSVIKNDDCGYLEISGGTFDSTINTGAANSTTLLNWNVAKISGGTFIGQYPISNGAYTGDKDKGELTISGGSFTGKSNLFGLCESGNGKGAVTISGGTFTAPAWGGDYSTKTGGYTVSVSGGTFNVDPTAYVDANAYAVTSGTKDGKTTYTVSIKTYTVTTNPLNGNETITQTVNHGSILELVDPTRAGYTFDGWYNGETKWTGGSEVTSNLTLIAHWTKNVEKGTDTKTEVTVNDDGTITETVTDKTGTATTVVETKTTVKEDGTVTVNEVKTATDSTNNVTTKTVVKNDTAEVTATVSSEAVTANAKTVNLDATTAGDTVVETTKVTLAAADATKMNTAATNGTVETVAIKTDVGTLTIDSTALKTITDKVSADHSLELVVKKTDEGTTSTQTTTTTTATYVLTALVDNKPVFEETNKDSNGTITITVPWTSAPGFRQQIVCYYVDGNTRTRMGGAGYKNNTFSWDTNHFSKFEVVSETVSNSRASINISGSSTGTTATTTTTTGKASSATTFDAGVGIYAVSAILSVTGMAWVGKKKH